MRELRFRAWDKAKQEFWDPKPMGMIYFDLLTIPRFIHQTYHEEGERMFQPRFEVMQYTGLKDKNGKEIYEGDVLSFDDMGEEGYEYKEGFDIVNRAAVTFEDGRFTLDNFWHEDCGVAEEIHDHRELKSVMEHSEVIGNIYEHAHLLEVKQDA